jgi:hypothetical protein
MLEEECLKQAQRSPQDELPDPVSPSNTVVVEERHRRCGRQPWLGMGGSDAVLRERG